MLRTRPLLCSIAFALVLFGCGGSFSPAQRVQDAVHDLSNAVRFGNMGMAIERVSPSERQPFIKRHARWGTAIRIVDCEVLGIALRDRDRADVTLSVGWQRVEESEMRSTQIAQKWKSEKGNWLLSGEERMGGDVGLLGEQVDVIRPPSGQDAQFRTITIR